MNIAVSNKMKRVKSLIQYNKDNHVSLDSYYKHSRKLSNLYSKLALKLFS